MGSLGTASTGNATVDQILTVVEEAAPIISTALNILAPGVGSILTGILSSIPDIITAVENDIAAFKNGSMTQEELQTKWTAMQQSFQASVAAWNAIPDATA